MSVEQGDVEATKRALEDPRTKAELLAALEKAEQEHEHVSRLWAIAAGRAEKAERALAEIVKFEGAVEGDESDQAEALVEVSRIARAALRPSEDTSDDK